MSILRVQELRGLADDDIHLYSGNTLDTTPGRLKVNHWTSSNRPSNPQEGTVGINDEGWVDFYYNGTWAEIGKGGGQNIIERGDPGSSEPLLLLENFNDVHYYYSSNNDMYMRTGLVPNAVYEMWYTSSGGASNVDLYLYPNGSTYGSEFRAHYRATDGSANFNRADQTLSHFYFDHFFGGSGADPAGKVWFTTGPTNKYMYYVGSDTSSLVIGYNKWTNNSRNWDWIGYHAFNGDNKRFWVRRVA